MQVVTDQMIDAFLGDDIKLKRQVFVPNEMAVTPDGNWLRNAMFEG